MKNIPIVGKFALIMALFGVFAAGVAGYSTSQMTAIDAAYSGLLSKEAEAAIRISRANRFLQAARASIADLLIATSEAQNNAAIAELASSRTDFVALMDSAAAAMDAGSDTVRELKASGLNLIDVQCGRAIKLGASATAPAEVLASQAVYLSECSPNFPPLTAKFSEAVNAAVKVSTDGAASLGAFTKTTIQITLFSILAGFVLVLGLGIYAARVWIVSPIKSLSSLMGVLATGNLSVQVEGIERRDELGEMSRAVQFFKEAGVEKLRLEAESERDRAIVAEERARNESFRVKAALEQATAIEQLGAGLSNLAKGDLTYRLTDAFARDYVKLQEDFNSTLETLQRTMTEITSNSSGIKSGSTEITTASDDLSHRTEQQAASLEETAAALEEITATVRRTSEGAQHAQKIVSDAKLGAETGGEVVQLAISAMSRIEQSSGQISQIISVIDEIAFQTNLLALNAGVEAARAGESGRGFAVVAQEVRALAQRSAEAAKEIKLLISASALEVKDGVELVAKTGTALRRIVEQVAEVNVVVTEIAASAVEQANGLQEVNIAVTQMDQVTQQNAAMVEESTAASHALAQEADALSRLMSQFKVGNSAQSAGQSNNARFERATTSGAARQMPALKTVSNNGNAARRIAPVSSAWEDF